MSKDLRLDRPADLPPEFKGWLVRYLEDNMAGTFGFLRLVTPGGKASHGSSSWTWTGSSESATTQIGHGLGVTPSQVFVTPGPESGGFNYPPSFQVTALDASTFDVQASTVDAQIPGFSDNIVFYWLAIA